ncbi:MAG: hypothetical protein IJD40_11390 [Lachnospiraceae bacterium]|nr:hypothetical protein [Lachnospiraceae bacterium]
MPVILNGLVIEEYAHPDDMAAISAIRNFNGLDTLLSKIGDKANQMLNRSIALGYYVRLTDETSPEIFRIIHDVCKILNYDKIPEVYSKRSYSIDIEVSGAEKPTMVIPDALINNYDEKFLYFAFGRAISKLKSDYLKFYTIARATIEIVEFAKSLPDAINLLFARWMQKAELTADRGGLLACQDCKTAIRFLMNYAGMPVAFTENVSIPEYIAAYRTNDKVVNLCRNLLTLTNCTGFYNDRIVELFNWYTNGGYGDVLDEYMF